MWRASAASTVWEKVFEKTVGIKTIKPSNPLLITPTGIAMSCEPFLPSKADLLKIRFRPKSLNLIFNFLRFSQYSSKERLFFGVFLALSGNQTF